MIRREELRRVAERKRISISNAEKDYLLEILLFAISQDVGDRLILKGGTSLYKLYNLNRFSEDLDFTLNSKRFNYTDYAEVLSKSTRLLGIYSTSVVETYNRETNVFFSFRGPLYDGRKPSICHISLNISHRERLSLPYVHSFLVSAYKEIPAFYIMAMDEREILAEKIRAILTRDKPRDVYDLWFLLKRGIEVDISLVNKKLEVYDKKFDYVMFSKSVRWKERIWDRDLKGLIIGNLPEFSRVASEISTVMGK